MARFATRDVNNPKAVHYQESYQLILNYCMTSKSTKYAKRTATAALMAVMLFGASAPALAQTSSADLQAQINALLAQIAALQANTGTTASVTFTRDLTIGSSGADVTALQNWLISKGFAIAAGATGYFGPQSQAALAKYQASVGIVPAAGYFGPVTRAKVNATAAPTTPTNPSNPDTGSTTLRGDEADLSDYDLKREESTGNESEEEVEIATASFDVEGGDIRIERMDLFVQGTNTSLNTQPWRYFDRIAILADGKEVAEKDVDSRSDWSKSGTGYRLSLTGMKHIVREGDTAELTIVADIAGNVDSADMAQTFTFAVEDRGIRAVDAEGIQQYIGDDADTVTFGFDAQENGDLRITTSRDNPDASILVADEDRESGEYEVFVFDLENRDDVDSLITDLTISVNGMNGGVLASDVIRRATLEIGRDSFAGDITGSTIEFEDMDAEIGGDDEVTATLIVRLARNATSTPIAFSLANANVEAEGVDSGDTAQVSGTASSETHTIAFAGIEVRGVSTAQVSVAAGDDVSSAYGTFTIKFTVAGLEEDAYIASTTAATGTVGVLYSIAGNAFSGNESAVLTSTARMQDGFYVVREGRTETFTLTVTLDPDTAGFYGINLNSIRFNDSADLADSDTYTVANDSTFRTDPVYIAN